MKLITLLVLMFGSLSVMAEQKIYRITPNGQAGSKWETTEYENHSMTWRIAYGVPGKMKKTYILKHINEQHDIFEKGFECYVTSEYANTGRPERKHIRYLEAQCHYHGTTEFIKSSCYNHKSVAEVKLKKGNEEVYITCD